MTVQGGPSFKASVMNRLHAKLRRNLRSLGLKLREAELQNQEPADEVFFAYMATWQALAIRDDALTAPYTAQRSDEPAEVEVDDSLPAFMADGLCAPTSDPTVDYERWFPSDTSRSARRKALQEAKEGCGGCPVRSECLEYALTSNRKYGIWGGLSERERRRLQRRGKVLSA
ncbi:WhiB family transcriptional regulator [Geodermatophilus nigrescens]